MNRLPPEIFTMVAIWLSPRDLRALSPTCHGLQSCVEQPLHDSVCRKESESYAKPASLAVTRRGGIVTLERPVARGIVGLAGTSTILHDAVCESLEVLTRLAERGFDVNSRDASGSTALLVYLAAGCGAKEVVELLLAREAIVRDAADINGNTPLPLTCSSSVWAPGDHRSTEQPCSYWPSKSSRRNTIASDVSSGFHRNAGTATSLSAGLCQCPRGITCTVPFEGITAPLDITSDDLVVPEHSSAIEVARLVGNSQAARWIHERRDRDVQKRRGDRAVE
ncbi:hypothetical protein C7212DRAFT_362854 [Tuber magnatum]|uniref:Uncharacterized protein n=1 Tax=Tuber magnatum TaxID=42249 RepID=A0A317SRZ9_9PEZI|nr:hypothetical protein C7212DRAFT_362854 [Tuber magnatum]